MRFGEFPLHVNSIRQNLVVFYSKKPTYFLSCSCRVRCVFSKFHTSIGRLEANTYWQYMALSSRRGSWSCIGQSYRTVGGSMVFCWFIARCPIRRVVFSQRPSTLSRAVWYNLGRYALVRHFGIISQLEHRADIRTFGYRSHIHRTFSADKWGFVRCDRIFSLRLIQKGVQTVTNYILYN